MADDDDKTVDNPPSNDPPDNSPPPHESHGECRGLITALSERVEELENTLRTVISVKTDSTPVNKPWTHRRLFR